MSTSGSARDDGSQKTHFIRRRVQLTDVGLASGVKIGRLPSRAFVKQLSWYKAAAFNSGTSDNATIGSTAGGNDILASTTITGTGFVNHTAAAGLGIAATASGEVDVFFKWAAVGTAATTGDLTVVLTYCPDNDG